MYIHHIIFIDLKAVFKPILFTILFITSFTSLYSQNLKLFVDAKDSINNKILNTIPYIYIHENKEGILREVDSISMKLAFKGFINNKYILVEKDSAFICTYTLNKKIDSILVYYDRNLIDENLLKKITPRYTKSFFEIPTSNIESTLSLIIAHFENAGASFTTASLQNLSQKENKLVAQLHLNITSKRTIDAIVVKGYDEFPKKYLNRSLKIKYDTPFNTNTLISVDQLINTIPFVSQIKKPEVLFTKDSTTLFLYLKKKPTSNFDGIIGFSNNKNNNNLVFNGYLDLQLNNVLNKGESFGVNWVNNGYDYQTLKINLNAPYIFNSNITPSSEFSIFKQDSTYTNTKSQFKLAYTLNQQHEINAILNQENSNLTSLSSTVNGIEAFKKYFLGFSYTFKEYSAVQKDNNTDLFISIAYLTGNRTIENIKSNQSKIQFIIEYLYDLNYKNSFFIKNSTELIDASNLLQNELFKIGGINSIRGFNEQSILTSKYTISNFEYHYKINETSHLYTITDVAFIKDTSVNSTNNLYSFGLGYYFRTNYSIINISYALGKSDQVPFNFSDSKIHLKITYPF